VACPKCRRAGCEPAALDAEWLPGCPRAFRGGGWGAPGISLRAGEDGVADLAFQAAQRFFAGLALGQLLVVVGAARAVLVPDLGDRGHVDRVVEPAVAAPGQPADLPAAGGHLDGRGAVAGGEVIPVREAGHVPDVAGNHGGDDRAGPEQPGQAGPRRGDRGGELLPGLADRRAGAAQIHGELGGELPAGRRHRACWRDRCQDLTGLACGDLLAEAAGHQLGSHAASGG